MHSLVQDLNLASYGSTAMETNRSLSPDETVLLLRELLTVFDEKFEPLLMSKLLGLECGFVLATGENIWAHRSEIEARHPDIRFRHDYVASSTIPSTAQGETPKQLTLPTSSQEPPLAVPIVTPAAVAAPTSSLLPLDTRTSVEPAPPTRTEARLYIFGVDNLRRVRLVGKQSPYCKWKLLGPSGQELASGRTNRHVKGGCSPDWSAQPFLIPLPKKLATLKGCSLLFVIKTATAVSSITYVELVSGHVVGCCCWSYKHCCRPSWPCNSETIGEGLHTLHDGNLAAGKGAAL